MKRQKIDLTATPAITEVSLCHILKRRIARIVSTAALGSVTITRRKTMSIEAMKQALDALEEHGTHYARHEDDYIKAITALRQAIEFQEMVKRGTKAWADTPDDWVDDLRGEAEAEQQKPVGEIVKAFEDLTAVSIPVMPPIGTKLYTAPSKREWVGLTAKDLAEIPPSCYEGAIWADAKLREKNT
jgi:hypothetical protein